MMKQWMVAVFAVTLVFAVGATVWAAAPTPYAPSNKPAALTYTRLGVEGKIVAVGKGWVELDLTKIMVKGTSLKTGEQIRVSESSRVKILQAGKAVPASTLKVGETISVTGSIAHRGSKVVGYRATTVQIMP